MTGSRRISINIHIDKMSLSYTAQLKEDIFGHVYLFSLLHIEICEIILTIGIKTPS